MRLSYSDFLVNIILWLRRSFTFIRSLEVIRSLEAGRRDFNSLANSQELNMIVL